jgi:hypothetical protein
VLVGSGRVLNDSDQVPLGFLKMQIGVAPDSHTKSPQELIRESNFASTPNVDSVFLLIQESVIRFILSHYFPLS